MGKIEKTIAGVGLILGGVAIGVFTKQWTLALAVAGAGLEFFRPAEKLGLQERQGVVLENRAGAREYLPVVYGTTKVSGILADLRVDENSLERKRLVVVMAFCHGSQDGSDIQAIDEIWFDDRRAVNLQTNLNTPFGSLVPGQKTTRYLEIGHKLGSTTQAVDSRLNQLFPVEWPSTSTGKGVVYSRMELWFSSDVYGGGLPNIQAVIRGNKVYDPRSAAWAFSTNPALCIRDYLLSSIYGLGVPAANIDEQSFIDAANYCDELIEDPDVAGGGTHKRFELNGWVDTSRSVEQNVIELCTACRGQVVNEGDKWRLIIRRERTVSGFKINEANTLEGSWSFILPGSAAAPNVARATYVDPARNYEVDTVQWPEPGAANAYLTQDNSYEQRIDVDLPFTDKRSRAQQIVMTLLKEGREGIGVTCSLKEEALQVRVGDLVEVTHPTPGWEDKIFDVVALRLAPDGSIQAVLAEYEPTSYDVDVQSPSPVIPDTNLPNPFSVVAPTSLVLTSQGQALQTNDGRYVPRLRATWSKSSDPFIDYYDVQARKAAGTDVLEWPEPPFDSTAFSHSGLSAFSAALVWNGNLTDSAWHTDSAVAGAWLKLDCGSGMTREFIECRIYAVSAGYAGTYDIEYSDNDTTWTTAATGFTPSASGKNSKVWTSVGAHRYWRIKLANTPGSGSWLAELMFMEAAYDSFGRVLAHEAPLMFVYPVTDEKWTVRVSAVNRIGARSTWLTGDHVVVTDDPRPQVLTITLTNAHVDTAHVDSHSDTAHSDAAHSDVHSDVAHDDSHLDSHTDHADHGDTHSDSHTDVHGDGDLHSDTHTDSHADSTAHGDTAHGDDHGDAAHTDSHTDVAHSDSAHGDGHTDAHGDGLHGIGVHVQADVDSASVRAVARKGGPNLISNGGGETGTVGSQATGWTFGAGNNLVPATDFFKLGSRSLKIDNPTVVDSYSYQDISVTAGVTYRVSGWIKVSALPTADAGSGAALNVDIVSGVTGWTIKSKTGDDFAATQPDVGVLASGVAEDWQYVECVFVPTGANGVIRLNVQLGYGGGQSGTAWFDDVRVAKVYDVGALPDETDVRTQAAANGRNVNIELIDVATGSQIKLDPGETADIAAIAYSEASGAGVEGPLARGRSALFSVAPVGTDKWVPS